MRRDCHSPGGRHAFFEGGEPPPPPSRSYIPPQSPTVRTPSNPELSKICTSYRPCRYTPEFEPRAFMNSRYSSKLPNLSSVTRLAVWPSWPFTIRSPGAGLAIRFLGPKTRFQLTLRVV